MIKKSLSLLMILILTLCGAGFHAGVVSASVPDTGWTDTTAAGTYQDILPTWTDQAYADNSGFSAVVTPAQFDGAVPEPDSAGYHGPAARFDATGILTFTVNVPTTGLYRFALDFLPLDDNYLDEELAVSVNGVSPYAEAGQIILYKNWDGGSVFSTDRFGNDFYASQSVIAEWTHQAFQDPMGFHTEPLCFLLEAGNNVVEFRLLKGAFLLGDVTVTGQASLPGYAAYRGGAPAESSDFFLAIEAETPDAKNSSSIQAGVDRDLGVTPFAVSVLKLNILAGSSFNSERESVAYDVVVPAAGFYHLSFKVRQSAHANASVFRTLRINGEIPFAEASALSIGYTTDWQNYTPSDASGTPYLFYLDAGMNVVSLSVDLSAYRTTYETAQTVLKAVNQLSLDIRKLTGNQVDEDRDWSIVDYMPSIVADLRAMTSALQDQMDYVDALNGSDRRSEVESSLRLCIRNLTLLADEPDEIPQNITMLSTSSASVASMLGTVIALLVDSPLDIDCFYVYANAELPEANAGFFARAWLAIKRFFLSFFEDRYSDVPEEGELEVWVNRSKQYVDLIQKMADDTFTTATGIPVKVSVMSSESKLILANSAGQNPDVALGIAADAHVVGHPRRRLRPFRV